MTEVTVSDFRYTPDDDVQIHEEGAIRLICSAFQSHEHGIPEWVKNSADECSRRGATEDERIIVVIFDKGTTRRLPSISVLDLGGIRASVIDVHFRHWASPDAAAREEAAQYVQGGHGNGGKCYMTMMFDDHALIHTVSDGRGSRYGVAAGSVVFGYIPDAESGKDFPVADTTEELRSALMGVGVNVDRLPGGLRGRLQAADGFSLVTGRVPHGYGSRIPVQQLVDHLRDHPQMLHSIEYANVYVVSNGKILPDCAPIVLEPVVPDAAFAEPRIISIPEELLDPSTGDIISTTGEGAFIPGTVTLRTSDVAMTHTRKARHTLIYRAASGYVGFRPIRSLGVTSSYQTRIYGECHLEALEALKQNQRQELADAPLSRAVDDFIRDQITEICAEFEARDARSVKQRERDGLSEINRALDEWKNKFLVQQIGALGMDTGEPPVDPSLPTGVPARIQIDLRHARSGIGVAFRPSIRFFDRNESRVRPTPFRWVSTNPNVAWVDEALRVITTFAPGRTTIYAETEDGKLVSNEVEIQVVRIRSIALNPTEIEVAAGGRRSITATCRLASGEELTEVALVWTEDDATIARVSATGTIFGGSPGVTKVSAGDDSAMADESVEITVVPAQEGGDDPTPGKGYPVILVSEINDDPETGERVQFSPDDPPIQQRPQDYDRNIWWINSAAPFARLFLDTSRGYGYRSREWRIYHIERYIDVIAQIALQVDPDIDRQTDVDSWLVARGTKIAAIQSAAASGLAEFIANGDVSTLQ